MKDIRNHWAEWRTGWEQKLTHTEIHFLRSVSELQAAFQHRVTLMDANYREQMKAPACGFRACDGATGRRDPPAILERPWPQVRLEYERIIHSELRLVRQRASLARDVERVSESAPPEFANVDWLKFAEKFRGAEDDIRARQRMYAAHFREHAPVLDHRLRTRRNAGSFSRSGHCRAGHRFERRFHRAVPGQRSGCREGGSVHLLERVCRTRRWAAWSAARWRSICRKRVCPK